MLRRRAPRPAGGPTIPMPSRRAVHARSAPKGGARAACGSTWSGLTSPLARRTRRLPPVEASLRRRVHRLPRPASPTSCFSEPTVCSSSSAASGSRTSNRLSRLCTSRIWASESQVLDGLRARRRRQLDVPAEDVLEHVVRTRRRMSLVAHRSSSGCRRSRSALARGRTPSRARTVDRLEAEPRVEVGDERIARPCDVGARAIRSKPASSAPRD